MVRKKNYLPEDFRQKIQNYRIRGSSGKVNLAFGALPDFICMRGEGPHHRGAISISPTLNIWNASMMIEVWEVFLTSLIWMSSFLR